MQTRRLKFNGWLAGLALLIGLFILAACTPSEPPLMKSIDTSDFESLHQAVTGKSNKYLILGSLTVNPPSIKIDPDLEVFLGRWEGYSYSPPTKKERKIVLVVQDINTTSGTAVYYVGNNLQYPEIVGQVHFRVVASRPPAIEWQVAWPDGTKTNESFRYVGKKDQLEGWSRDSATNRPSGPYELTREQNFTIYKDYPQYLSGKGIYAETYLNPQLNQYGPGYLYYLPDDYQTITRKAWPLLIFLHDSIDTGGNIYSLARSSPFIYILEQGSLPMIVVAPQLSAKPGQTTFSMEYLDGVLAEIQSRYRINTVRIYVTGLGMGGEATWRFALHRPDAFAAIAPLSAYLNPIDPAAMKTIAKLPVWAIHGNNDFLVPVDRGEKPAKALNAVGGKARFSVLPGHDHDVWTDIYSDPDFYNWLMQNYKHTLP